MTLIRPHPLTNDACLHSLQLRTGRKIHRSGSFRRNAATVVLLSAFYDPMTSFSKTTSVVFKRKVSARRFPPLSRIRFPQSPPLSSLRSYSASQGRPPVVSEFVGQPRTIERSAWGFEWRDHATRYGFHLKRELQAQGKLNHELILFPWAPDGPGTEARRPRDAVGDLPPPSRGRERELAGLISGWELTVGVSSIVVGGSCSKISKGQI